MTRFTEAYDFHGRTLVDRDGEKIGTVDEVYNSQEGGTPEWALVHTGLFGTRKNFVPLRGASPGGGEVHVAVDRQAVKDSPSLEADEQLSEAEERRLFEHYGIPYTAAGSTAAQGVPGPSARPTEREADGDYEGDGDHAAERGGTPQRAVGSDAPGPTTDDAMTRSEEELRVGTRSARAGRARLRKYVVTEDVSRPCRCGARRSASSASRSPTPTATPPRPARRSPRRSTRSCSTRSRSWSRSAPCRRSACASTRTRSPTRSRSPRTVRKEQIDVDDESQRP